MRVLVIGGTGFIGRHVSRLLDAAGCEVTVFHRGSTEGDLPTSVRHVRHADAAIPILDFPDELRRLEPEVVVHVVPVGQRDAAAAVRAFRGVARRLVAVSSGDVYRAYGSLIGTELSPTIGTEPPLTIGTELSPTIGTEPSPTIGTEPSPTAGAGQPAVLSEDAPLRTKLYPYGEAVESQWGIVRDYEKILVERAVMGAPDLPGTVLRLPKVYGPGSPRPVFLPWIRRMGDNRPAIVLGEAQARWRWTHGYVEDVADAIALAATNECAAGRTYNVGERRTPTVLERVRRLAAVIGWQGRLVLVPDERLPADLRLPFLPLNDLAYDTTRIRAELGYAERVPSDDGLAETVAWEREQSARWPEQAALDYHAEDELL